MSEKLGQPVSEEIVIEDGLVLRAVDLTDAPRLQQLINDNRDYLGQFLPWAVDGTNETIEDAEKFVRESQEKSSAGKMYGFGIVVEGEICGHISIFNIKSEKEDPEIGYWIARNQSGKGVTTKACHAILELGFTKLNLDKIVLMAKPNNIGSNRIAQKTGFSGPTYFEHPEHGESNRYEITKDQWQTNNIS